MVRSALVADRRAGLIALRAFGADDHAALAAAEHVRTTGTPYFLELDTYRQRGHYEPDDQAYVDTAELARWKQRDPLVLQRERLLKDGTLAGGELAHLEQRVAATVDAAFAFAQNSAWPDVRELTTDVYA